MKNGTPHSSCGRVELGEVSGEARTQYTDVMPSAFTTSWNVGESIRCGRSGSNGIVGSGVRLAQTAADALCNEKSTNPEPSCRSLPESL